MSLPSYVIVPADGVSSPRTIRAVVVLPDPDSPTSASVRPRVSVNDTPSTARTEGGPEPLRGKAKDFVSPSADRRTSDPASRLGRSGAPDRLGAAASRRRV